MSSTSNTFNPDDFWQQRLSKVEGLEGVGYAKLGKPFNIWGYKVRQQAFYNIINPLKYNFRAADVLDVGSGTGFYIAIWNALQAKKVTGVDITEVAVENLKTKFPEHQFLQLDIGDDLGQLNHKLGQKDFISAMDVLFHIVDDKRFEKSVHNIASMLKPGGYFIYSDNFLNGDTIRTRHQVSRTKKYLFDLFEKAGFETVDHKPFMVLSNYPVDSKNKLLHAYWYVLENSLALFKPLGHLAGAALYPIEKYLLRRLKDSPSTEIVLLRKKPNPTAPQ